MIYSFAVISKRNNDFLYNKMLQIKMLSYNLEPVNTFPFFSGSIIGFTANRFWFPRMLEPGIPGTEFPSFECMCVDTISIDEKTG